jgi:uncharacterized membrane protein YjjP (DUF1212 family)
LTETEDASALLRELGEAAHVASFPSDVVDERLRDGARALGLTADVLTLPSFLALEVRARDAGAGAGAAGQRVVEVRRIPFETHWNLRRVAALDELGRAIVARRLGVAEARAALADIGARPNRFGKWTVALGYAVFGAAVAARVGGAWREMLAAGLIGLLAGWIHYGTIRSNNVDLQQTLFAALAGTLAAFALSRLLPPFNLGRAIYGGVALLVPATSLTIGVHELANDALESGTVRIAQALLRFLMLGFGIMAAIQVAAILGLEAPPVQATPLPYFTKLAVVAAGSAGLLLCLQGRLQDLPAIVLAVVIAHGSQDFSKMLVGERGAPAVSAFLLGAAAQLYGRVPGRLPFTMMVPGLLQLTPGFLGTQAMFALLRGGEGRAGAEQTIVGVLLVSLQLATGLLVSSLLFRRRPPRSRRRAVAAAVLLAGAMHARPAGAWASVEHQQLGQTSYLRACGEITAAATPRAVFDPGVAARLEVACGRNVDVTALLYGDATAIAGDYLSHPSEFFTQQGAWTFNSKKNYLLLALENSQHFNPMATRSWAEYHQRAVADALAAAGEQGLATTEGLSLAIQESAFADHFLSDSFAAGHMGFNRTASSAGAAKAFHDSWNRRGRAVADRSGRRWFTYGDGFLDAPENQVGRQHVLDASTLSIGHVLRVYVLGEPSPAQEMMVWNAVPFIIEAPELLVGAEEILTGHATSSDHQLVPVLGTIRPAWKDTVGTAALWGAATFDHPRDEILAVVGAVELGVPLVPAQTYLGLGGTLHEPFGDGHSVVLDTGVLVPLGLSLDGLLSHELNVTASWIFRSSLVIVVHAEYQLNVELGNVLVSLNVGLAEFFPKPQTGWFGGLSLGYVFSAAGGGSF